MFHFLNELLLVLCILYWGKMHYSHSIMLWLHSLWSGYGHLEFREELIIQLAGIRDGERPPLFTLWLPPSPGAPPAEFLCTHMPAMREAHERRNCRVCWSMNGRQNKSTVYCQSRTCKFVTLCFTSARNCFQTWHSAAFDNHNPAIELVI